MSFASVGRVRCAVRCDNSITVNRRSDARPGTADRLRPAARAHPARRIRHLRHQWDEEDATRDALERQAKRAFREQEANELFAPIENHLIRLGRVLQAANVTVDVDPTWEYIGEQKLRRSVEVIFRATAGYLPLDLTIEGTSIFYRNSRYRFPGGIEALIHVITADVEQFIAAQGRAGALRADSFQFDP